MPRIRELNPHIPGVEAWEEKPSARAEATVRDLEALREPHSMQESEKIIAEGLAAAERKRARAEGRISFAKNVSEIRHERHDGKKIAEGAVSYIKVENDAVIINASDAHGSFDDLMAAIKEFVQRRERGEHIYFNYSGDVSSGDVDQVIPCIEALASLQAKYPNEVTIEFGNGERRGTSLLVGLAREATKRFAPELDTYLETRTQELVDQFAKENNITDPKKAKRSFNIFYASELLRLARMGGAQPGRAHELNPEFLSRMFKALGGMEKAGGVAGEAVRNLRLGVSEPARGWDKRKASGENQRFAKEAKKIFGYRKN
ncbi:MAG: hypothetical protein AB1465_03175 [Patescibacteria group bacterium]